jgi:hypothetical protein
MKEKYFEWLLDSCTPRKGGKLEKGKIYKVGDYPEDTVAEWVKSKAAKYVKGGILKEEDE